MVIHVVPGVLSILLPALNERSSALLLQSLTPTFRSTRAGICDNLGSYHGSGGCSHLSLKKITSIKHHDYCPCK